VKNQILLSVVDSCAIAPGVREKLKPRLAEALGDSIQTLRRWSRQRTLSSQTIGAKKVNRNLKYVAALAMAMSPSLVMPALAQMTWLDTEGSVHIEKPAPLDMEHAKADQKYRPILAVARVFYLRFNMSTANKILILDEDSATIGPYTIKRFDEDCPCQFDLKKGNDKLAEINFNLLTEKVEEAPTLNGSSYGVAVYGKMGAVC